MSGARRDYYAILGVPRDASAEAVKLAFRRIARATHPDQNPDLAAADTFKAAAEAYDVLSDPAKRAMYDRFGQVPQGAAYGAPAVVTPARVVESWARSVAKTVRDRVRNGRGDDLRFNVRVRFEDAILGTPRIFELPRKADGRTAMRRLEFRLPPGVRNGQTLRWKGEGAPSGGDAAAGDLIVEVAVEPHAFYRRDGHDIVAALPLGLALMMRGGRLQVPTVFGTRELEIAPGTRPGTRLRLAGCGVRTPERTGDAIFDIELDLPAGGSDDLLELARVFDARVRATPSMTRSRFEAELKRAAKESR
jgi:curved DNA-binding protein